MTFLNVFYVNISNYILTFPAQIECHEKLSDDTVSVSANKIIMLNKR